MKLYQSDLSPFSSRVRLALYAKNLKVETELPAGGNLKAPEYLAINPLGKIPTLVLDDGTVIPESEVILEYLDDQFPDSPLRPANASDRARARLLARFVDLYLFPAIGSAFAQMNPATRDEMALADQLATIDKQLSYVEQFLGAGPFCIGAKFSTADCALAPVLFLLTMFAAAVGKPDILARFPKLSACWAHLQNDPNVKRVTGEMQTMFAMMTASQPKGEPAS